MTRADARVIGNSSGIPGPQKLAEDAVLRRVEELITVTVAGSTVVHNPIEDRYVELSPSAALLWREIEPEASVGALALTLSRRYGVASDRALADAAALAAALAERGLVELG